MASLEKELGSFLRKQRGERTFAQFARRLRLPASTLHRLEMGRQSITLRRLQMIMRRLGVGLEDIFADNIQRSREKKKQVKKKEPESE